MLTATDSDLIDRIDTARELVQRMRSEIIEKDRLIWDLQERLRIISVAIDLGIQVTS